MRREVSARAGPVVGAFGNSYWAARLAESLCSSPVAVQPLYVDQERDLRTWSLRRWLAETAPWACDVLHVLGWPTLWNLWVAARLRDVPTVYHWLGTDASSFRRSPRWSRVAGPMLNGLIGVHLADSPTLVAELREVGVYARHETVGLRRLDAVPVLPLPAEPCALAMLRPDKFEFYGGREVLEMARRAPDIRWLIAAHDGAGLPPLPNVEYLGDVRDMDPVYARTTVLVRLTQHDGVAQMVLEALARGRYVVWSYPMPHCRLARSADEALPAVREVAASRSPNLAGAEYVRQAFDAEAQARRLGRLYRVLARR